MIHKSMSLKHEPASEPLHFSVKAVYVQEHLRVWAQRYTVGIEAGVARLVVEVRAPPHPVCHLCIQVCCGSESSVLWK